MHRPRIRHGHALASGQSRAARRIASLLLSGLVLSAVPTVAVLAQDAPPPALSASDPHAAHIAEAAQRFGIPEPWIRAVLHVESAGDVDAISSAGAMGLMQVMPGTWAELRLRYRLGSDPFDPRDNILAGTAYLREMLDRYGNTGAMLAAYNAGPARYDDYLADGRVLPAETRAYVAMLAPLVGGDPLPAGAVAVAARPSDWREASLFADPSTASEPAPDLHGERPENRAATAPPAHAHPHALAPSGELFVTRSMSGGGP